MNLQVQPATARTEPHADSPARHPTPRKGGLHHARARKSLDVRGETVYDRCHLGHARCYLAFDLIHRWLESSGYDVHYVQNFTDIDDKIIQRANELDGDWKALVEQNIQTYYEDMDALNILRADDYPCCTEYVEDMVRITQDLIDKGHAYVADDGVYFDVESAPEKYGQLTGQSIDAVRSGLVDGLRPRVQVNGTTRTSPCGRRPNPTSQRGFPLGTGAPGLAHRMHSDVAGPLRQGV